MKDYKPVYFDKFQCVAGRCKHNCCIGWEIDIDPLTLKKYRNLSGDLGEKLRKSITEDDGCAFFAMKENGRCPFLSDCNLCEIIQSIGDENLCDICREHPRFYNYFNSRTEWGLGLCCEEAARIIVSCDIPFSLTEAGNDSQTEKEDDFENFILQLRDECIIILENGQVPLSDRLSAVLSMCKAEKSKLSPDKIHSTVSSLEYLCEESRNEFESLTDFDINALIDSQLYSHYFKNIAEYFVYRQLSGAFYDGNISERAEFVAFSVTVIAALCKRILLTRGILSEKDIAEKAREFSAEVEYSDSNMEFLIDRI